MGKETISSSQLGILLYFTVVATAILDLPAITYHYAKNDLWISPIWASLNGFVTVFVAYMLHKLFPGKNLIQYSVKIVGKIPGKIIGLIILLYYLFVIGYISRNYAEFIVTLFFPQTPIGLVISIMMIICALAVYGGVEVIARMGQIVLPLFLLPLLVTIFLLIPELKSDRIYPIFGNGLKPSLLGAIPLVDWFTELFLISYFFPIIKNAKSGMKWGMWSSLAVMITLSGTNIIALFLFGADTDGWVYPILSAAQYISIADFIENIEAVIMLMWVVGSFIKISVFLYVTAVGTSDWLKLSDYRPIVWPLAIFAIQFSFWDMENFAKITEISTMTPFIFTYTQTMIPLILLVIALIRKKLGWFKEAAEHR